MFKKKYVEEYGVGSSGVVGVFEEWVWIFEEVSGLGVFLWLFIFICFFFIDIVSEYLVDLEDELVEFCGLGFWFFGSISGGYDLW